MGYLLLVTLTQFVCLFLFHFEATSSLSPISSSSSSRLCLSDQSHALLLFKNSFSISSFASYKSYLDTPHPKTQSWKDGTDCCFWDGVTCDFETGYVIGLHLSSSMLFGSIYDDNPLFSLSHLQNLDLSNNNFNSSHISPRFGYLFNLVSLNLNDSDFSDQVPSEISQLSNLISLDLSWNYELTLETSTFNRIVHNLTNLREVSLNGVDMSMVAPSSLMNLSSSLSSLRLGNCGLGRKFLDYVPLSSRLLLLDLSYNDLKLDTIAFSKLVKNLINLRELYLSFANLSMVEPSSFQDLPSSLSSLKLEFCQLEGKFPDVFHLSKLVSLDLSDNINLTIDGVAFDKLVQKLPKLREVELSFVDMSLVEPSSFSNFSSSLSSLSLSYCGLRGEFPSNFFQRPNLQFLYLGGNDELNGSLPTSNWSSSLQALGLSSTKIPISLGPGFFNNLKSLKWLDLSACNFVDSNLESLGTLTQLTYLDLSSNNFKGQIPSSFQNFTQLSSLILAYNNFSGLIPDYFANFTQLQFLFLAKNQLSGSIPSLPLSSLYYIDFSRNKLNGTIPPSLFDLPNLMYLYLHGNQLHGSISQIRSNSVVRIVLRDNKFHGTIPSVQSESLSFFDFSNNLLDGPILDSIFNVKSLNVLKLSSNLKLSGQVPSSLCELHSLEILDLSNNSLNGFLPPCLGNLSKSLSVLHLGNNNFQGTISNNSFLESCGLRYLNFEGNQLQGRVPSSIINCIDLEFLDLSNNQIEDAFPLFLGILPHLQVLVISSNKFHGLVRISNASYPFSKLRIFYLSKNSFNGPLPAEYFDHFDAMINSNQVSSYMSSEETYAYTYSVNLTFKGLEFFLPKIQNMLTAIDLSQNKFTGSIPNSIGKLQALRQLNLSHNHLGGNIPPSLRNLTNLESLDLSSNLLCGRIPIQLPEITTLEVFSVAHNQLEGSIPQGKQFGTFDKSSYEGNSGCNFRNFSK